MQACDRECIGYDYRKAIKERHIQKKIEDQSTIESQVNHNLYRVHFVIPDMYPIPATSFGSTQACRGTVSMLAYCTGVLARALYRYIKRIMAKERNKKKDSPAAKAKYHVRVAPPSIDP